MAQPRGKTKVGVLLPLTGDFGSVGNVARKSIEEQELHALKLNFEDSACNARKALDAYRKFSSSDGVRLFLGPCCGNELESIAPIIATKEQLMVSLCSTSSAVYGRSNGKILSSVFSVEAESEFMAKQFKERGIRKIAIVYFSNSFSEAHERAFRRVIGHVDVHTLTFDTLNSETVRGIVLRLRKAPPDAVYVPDLTPFLMAFTKQLRSAGLTTLPIFSIHAVQTQQVLDAEGDAAEGIVFSHPDTGDEAADHYFPRVAATMLDRAIMRCADDVACIKKDLLMRNSFEPDGAMTTTFVLRTISKGKFVPIEPSQQLRSVD